jgi:CMP-N-acetylneuraminic acid synthetase
MSCPPTILGLVPARAGSKRLEGKNHRDLCGKPLVTWTLEAAKTSAALTDIIVSTDDPLIDSIAGELCIECIPRPAPLATDAASSLDVMIHALDILGKAGREFDAIMLLQPTSPLRGASEIRAAVELFRRHPDRSVVSMCESECPRQWLAEPGIDGTIKDYDPARRAAAQARLLRLNGAIYIVPTKHLREKRSLYTELTAPYVMPRSVSIDIDTEEDFLLCQYLVMRRLPSSPASVTQDL